MIKKVMKMNKVKIGISNLIAITPVVAISWWQNCITFHFAWIVFEIDINLWRD